VSRYQKGKTNLDFTEARDSEWQWHQLGHMQASTLLQTDNHTSTPPQIKSELIFLTFQMITQVFLQRRSFFFWPKTDYYYNTQTGFK